MVKKLARTIKCNIKLSGSAQRFRGRTWPSANILEGIFQEQGRNPVPLGMGGCQELRPHQTQAGAIIEQAWRAKLPGFLLADEVGLGKTLSAWLGVQLVAQRMKAQRVVIVCPLSVQAHWRETLRRQGSVVGEVLIINYERLSKLFELDSGVKVKSKKGLARRGSAAETDIIIFDESHKLKNPTAARSKLAAKLTNAAQFVLWLSATAG